jgi:LacI family transcriptional regulator
MPRATLDDVAKLAGVSIKTASRVVNKEPNVRAATEEKVNKAILELSYRPNQSARNLASQRSHLIGLVYDDPAAYDLPSSGYIINMQQGVLKACKNFNYDLLIHPFNFRDKGVDEELKSLVEHARPIGIILAAPLSNMRKIVRAIENTDTPLVRMSPGATNGKHSTIATNDREISAEMTRYLVSLGHKRIAFIKGDSGHKAVSNRFLGYKDGLKEAGLAYSESMVCEGDNSIGSGEAAGTTLLQRKKSPTAIFAANDDMAAGVVRVADRLGINVPAQLSIAGFDDIPLARQIYPALTTIRQPLATMAERAAVSLIQATRNMPPTRIVEIVPAQIQIRDSTGPAPN